MFDRLTYEEKLKLTKTKIQAFYTANEGRVALAFSGGKDSTVLAHIIDSIGLHIEKVFTNTGNEHKEIYNFIKNKKQEDRIIVLQPSHPFRWSVIHNGYPLISKQYADIFNRLWRATYYGANTMRSFWNALFYVAKGKPVIKISSYSLLFWTEDMFSTAVLDNSAPEKLKPYLKQVKEKLEEKYFKVQKYRDYYNLSPNVRVKVTNKCCDLLKKQPMARFQKKYKVGVIVGTRAEESLLRRTTLKKRGCWNKNKNILQPLLWWAGEDIERYIRENNVEISKAYETEERTGCVLCAFGLSQDIHRFDRLRQTFPKRWEQAFKWQNLESDISFGEALEIFEDFIKRLDRKEILL